jgi:hypothetical protein
LEINCSGFNFVFNDATTTLTKEKFNKKHHNTMGFVGVITRILENQKCRDINLGLTTKAMAYKGAGQK